MIKLTILAIALVAASCALSVHASSAMIEGLECRGGRGCMTTGYGNCLRKTYPSGACVNDFFGQKTVTLEVMKNQICVNATSFSDSACTSPAASVTSGCTTCMPGLLGNAKGLRYDCGGLFGSMFTLTGCDATCSNCNTERVAYSNCTRIPGLPGQNSIIVHGEVMCTQVKVSEYAAGSSCSGTPTSSYRVMSGACFESLKLTVQQ